jgi:hypothetical protein
MISNALKNTDPLDIDEAIESVEKTFGIHFQDNDFKNIRAFGEFCEMVKEKTNSEDLLDCTTQQTFYKLRSAYTQLQIVTDEVIRPRTELTALFPPKHRKNNIRRFQEILGIKLSILYPPKIIEIILAITIMAGFVSLFIDLKIGTAVIVLSFIGLHLGRKLGNNFRIKTFGDLAKQLKTECYSEVRNSPAINKNEVKEIVKQIFMDKIGIDRKDLIDEAKFGI